MPYTFEDLVAHERRRWMRPDAHLFVRQDARGADDCGGALWRERLLHPDHRLWNFHVPTNARRGSPAEQAAKGGQGLVAETARLQAQHDTLRRAFVELKQQRQRERALERAEAERLKRRYDAAWNNFIAAFNRHWDTCSKAGFDPEQPRDERGKWTDSGSSDRPNIPKERPPTARLRNRVIKEVAKWLAKAAAREVAGPVGTLLNIAEAGSWLYEAYPYVRAYLDEPKTLDELQRAARTSEAGYNIHHVVEQTPAEQDGYPRSLIDGPENLVHVPTLKHWEITGWYMMPNDDYGGLSPRVYLRGKSWEERRRVGIDALVKHRVLKP